VLVEASTKTVEADFAKLLAAAISYTPPEGLPGRPLLLAGWSLCELRRCAAPSAGEEVTWPAVRDVFKEAAGTFAASAGRPALLVIDGADILAGDQLLVKELVGLAKARTRGRTCAVGASARGRWQRPPARPAFRRGSTRSVCAWCSWQATAIS
jgi:hypothetical protein